MRTIYLVQSVAGYEPGGNPVGEQRLREAGFIQCKSEPDAEGKHWEVWLGYDFLLKVGKTKAEVMRFLRERVRPGTISIASEEEHWGLCVD